MRGLAYGDAGDDLKRIDIDDGNPTQKPLGHPEFLAVGRNVHAVRPARNADAAHDLRIVLGVDQGYRALDAIAEKVMAAVAFRKEIVGTLAGLEAALHRTVLGIDDGDPVLTGQCDQQALVIRQHHDTRRRVADRHVPLERLRRQIEGRKPPALLQRDEDRLGLGIEGNVARQPVDEDATGKTKAIGMIDVDMVEPVGRRDEPLAVGTEAQMVGIEDVLHDPLAFAGIDVEAEQLVGRRRPDDHFLAIGRHDQVVRLAPDREAGHLCPRAAAQDAVRSFVGIQDDN